MADFSIAIAPVLKHEGYYSNVKSDRGGETYAGITRRNNPNWPGWKFIDAAKPLKRHQRVPAVDPFVAPHYERNYWSVIRGAVIADQAVAGFLLDWYVNSGTAAIKNLQRAVGATPDGIFGPATLRAVNAAPGPEVFARLQKARVEFVTRIVENDPGQRGNLAGWLRRIGSFKY